MVSFICIFVISNSPFDCICSHLVCFNWSIFKRSKSCYFLTGGLKSSVLLEDVICPLKNRQFLLDLKAVKAKNLCLPTLRNCIPFDQVEIIKGGCRIFLASCTIISQLKECLITIIIEVFE